MPINFLKIICSKRAFRRANWLSLALLHLMSEVSILYFLTQMFLWEKSGQLMIFFHLLCPIMKYVCKALFLMLLVRMNAFVVLLLLFFFFNYYLHLDLGFRRVSSVGDLWKCFSKHQVWKRCKKWSSPKWYSAISFHQECTHC